MITGLLTLAGVVIGALIAALAGSCGGPGLPLQLIANTTPPTITELNKEHP